LIMDAPENKELERFIHEQLRKLPEHEAPANLLENVMKVIAARRALPWWKQPFTEWPRQNQALLFAALAMMLGGAFYLAWTPAEQLSAAALAEKARPFAWLRIAETVFGSFLLALRNLPWSWLAVIAAVFMMMYTACVGAGLALYRITAHRAFSFR
jgi:hypothetical protein